MGLGSFDRATNLEQLRDGKFDVIVVGGGITGAGVALDAASRGLRTALVERDDFASGTSSKSSKLVHGGLRYLQQGEITLVYEALHERHRLLRNAPHLVQELPFLIPLLSKDGLLNPKIARTFGVAMWGYDLTGGLRSGKLHRRVSTDQALDHCPVLRRDRVAGAYVYYDCTADDARLTLTLARTAALGHGAVVANGAACTGMTRDRAGRIEQITLTTAEGESFTCRAGVVVNAGGVWADAVADLEDPEADIALRPAKGVHITLPRHLFGNDIALVLPVPKDRRSIFVVPHGEVAYVGTTDTDYEGPLEDPHCTADDIAYLLGALRASTTVDVGPEAILGTWAGLRPLVKAAGSSRTADLSRRHKVYTSSGGLVTVTGGKLTTYRKMAADAVDVLADVLEGRRVGRSRTKGLKLWGAEGYPEVVANHTGRSVLTDGQLAHLAGRYGGEAGAVVALVQQDPELAEPLVSGLPYLRAEAVFSARYEMVRTVDDLLARRTRSRLYGRDASEAAAPDAAALLGRELGWPAGRVAAEVATYAAALQAERAAEAAPAAAALAPGESVESVESVEQ